MMVSGNRRISLVETRKLLSSHRSLCGFRAEYLMFHRHGIVLDGSLIQRAPPPDKRARGNASLIS